MGFETFQNTFTRFMFSGCVRACSIIHVCHIPEDHVTLLTVTLNYSWDGFKHTGDSLSFTIVNIIHPNTFHWTVQLCFDGLRTAGKNKGKRK